MLPKKYLSSKLSLLCVSGVFLFLGTLLFQSCKKVDISNDIKNSINDKAAVTKFLAVPHNINPTVNRIISTIKQQEDKYHFLNKIIKEEGFAMWQNARIMTKSNPIQIISGSVAFTTTSSNQTTDTIVLIPLVLENTSYVNSFISCNVNDTVQIKLYRGRDYSSYNFSKNTDSLTAHKIALTCMNLEYETFQHNVFNIKDKRLLNYRADGKVPSKTTLTIKPPSTTPQSWVTIFYSYDIEVENENPFEVLCPEGQACKWTHTETVYDNYTFWVSDFGNWNGADFPNDPWQQGYGQGGGSYIPCGGTCTPVIDSWEVVTDPVEVSIFSNLNNPINVPDDPIIQQSLIQIGNIQINPPLPIKRIGKTQSRNNTEDMTYGNTCDASDILSNMPNFTDAQLFDEMNSLFHSCTALDGSMKSVGDDMIQKFKDKTGGTFTDPTLSQKAFESSAFKNFVITFGGLLNQALANANWNINNVSEIDIPQIIRPVFNGFYNKFHGLQILVNDTEQTEIELNGFIIDPVTHKWTASITVKIKDHFGLDKNDALTYQNKHAGFAAWWILQHCRGYKPFETNLVINMELISQP